MGSSYDSDEEEEEEEEEDDEEIGNVRGTRFLGFMFGNVDESGDLDADYLDDDEKENLAALADDLGSSLSELKSTVDVVGQDCGDEKAENAVDYFDIDEELEEDDEGNGWLSLRRKEFDFLAGQVSLSNLVPNATSSVLDDENYDEEEIEQQAVENDDVDVRSNDLPVEKIEVFSDKISSPKTPLPVLCVGDGSAILRFTELFSFVDDVRLNKREQKSLHNLVGCSGTKDGHRKSLVVCHDIVEEDEEEAFLKGFQSSTQAFSAVKHDISKSSFKDDDLDIKELRRKNVNAHHAVEKERQSPFGANFYPLDLQDWEDEIIWDDCPLGSESSDENNETSGPDSEPQTMIHNSSSLAFSASKCHPQLSRLESRAEVHCTVRNSGGKLQHSSAVRQLVCKLPAQSGDMMDGSWLDQIIWDPDSDIPTEKPKLILDLQDEQMLFEILDNKDTEHLRLHSRAMMVLTPLVASLLGHEAQFSWKDVAGDIHYLEMKAPQHPKPKSKKPIANGRKVCHSQPALVKKKSSVGQDISDMDSFAGDLEMLLDAEESEAEVGLGGDHESKLDKPDGGKVTKKKKKRALVDDDDDDDNAREKKKTRVSGEEEKLAAVGDSEMVDNLSKEKDREVEPNKNATTTVTGLMNKTPKLCGACGQLGHMRTNKNCPKYRCGEDLEKASGKSTHRNSSGQPKSCATKSSTVENVDPSKKVLRLKITWGNTENVPVESDYKPPIVKQPPMDTISSQDVQLEKPSVVIGLPENTDRKLVDCSQKQLSPVESQREEHRYPKTKLIIRLPKKF